MDSIQWIQCCADDFGDFGRVRQATLTYRLYRIRGASAILQIPGQRDKAYRGDFWAEILRSDLVEFGVGLRLMEAHRCPCYLLSYRTSKVNTRNVVEERVTAALVRDDAISFERSTPSQERYVGSIGLTHKTLYTGLAI